MINQGPVYINGRFLTQHMTGIQRFSHELCKALISQGIEIIILAPKRIRSEYTISCPVIRFGIFKDILWEQFDLPLFLLKHKNPLLLNFGSPGPVFYSNRIVTVHDLSFWIHPHWFSKPYYLYYRLVTPIFTRLSKKVITVSEFSKKEIQRLIGIPEQKIAVIHNAVSPDFRNRKPSSPARQQKYILSVGSLDPRKNLSKLVEAYKLAGIGPEIKLVLAGKTDQVFNNVTLSADILAHSAGYVPDEELASLYENALLFVYPSLYEGFGIPPLEAMSMDCPVVLSDIPVFREIFGDAACFADPSDAGSICSCIQKVLADEPYREELIHRGRERVKLYSWERSAEKLITLISSLP